MAKLTITAKTFNTVLAATTTKGNQYRADMQIIAEFALKSAHNDKAGDYVLDIINTLANSERLKMVAWFATYGIKVKSVKRQLEVAEITTSMFEGANLVEQVAAMMNIVDGAKRWFEVVTEKSTQDNVAFDINKVLDTLNKKLVNLDSKTIDGLASADLVLINKVLALAGGDKLTRTIAKPEQTIDQIVGTVVEPLSEFFPKAG